MNGNTGGIASGPSVQSPSAQLVPQPTMTVDGRIKGLEDRVMNLEQQMAVSERVYTTLINEINSLREQCGLAPLDHGYYQP